MAKNGCSNFFLTIFPKRTGINQEWQKCLFQSFSDNFSQKDWYKFGMAKNGHSNVSHYLANNFSQFFPRRLVQIWNGQKWPFQLFSNNFSQKDWYKFGMAKNGCSNIFRIFFPTMFPILKDWYKLAMAKNGCSNFVLTIFLKRTGINQEWPKMLVPIFF